MGYQYCYLCLYLPTCKCCKVLGLYTIIRNAHLRKYKKRVGSETKLMNAKSGFIYIYIYIYIYFICISGLGSVVGIATGYELDGPGIESRWR